MTLLPRLDLSDVWFLLVVTGQDGEGDHTAEIRDKVRQCHNFPWSPPGGSESHFMLTDQPPSVSAMSVKIKN